MEMTSLWYFLEISWNEMNEFNAVDYGEFMSVLTGFS